MSNVLSKAPSPYIVSPQLWILTVRKLLESRLMIRQFCHLWMFLSVYFVYTSSPPRPSFCKRCVWQFCKSCTWRFNVGGGSCSSHQLGLNGRSCYLIHTACRSTMCAYTLTAFIFS